MTRMNRRRFLTVSAACAALPAVASSAQTARWQGTALGASASLRLEGLTDARAAPIIAAVEAELERLELIFSLYRPESELTQLNSHGVLNAPSPELLSVLSLCSALHDATGGAFDPTVQPLWMAAAMGAGSAELRKARSLVGWRTVSVRPDRIALGVAGQSALTLNGIAQGEITDRIVALLKGYGLRDILVDMGEVAAMGLRADGMNWKVGLSSPDGIVRQRITLQDRAVATSAPAGTMLSDSQGHIVGPIGQAARHQLVSVSAPRAAVADGLSTALCLMQPDQIDPALAHFAGARLEILM